MKRHALPALAFGILALATIGCGDPNLVIAKGQVTVDGQPITLSSQESIDMYFMPVPEGKGPPADTLPARVDRDGSFVCAGGMRKGIPKGKYYITIDLDRGRKDNPLRAALGARSKEPMILDVNGDYIEIDLSSKPPG